jgi:hypothetical protein
MVKDNTMKVGRLKMVEWVLPTAAIRDRDGAGWLTCGMRQAPPDTAHGWEFVGWMDGWMDG